jgi:cytidyltransferase-like protein
MKIVCTSGGFDPLHYGHILYLQEAAKLADRHIVILNGDSFLIRKKGYLCISAKERRDILLTFPFIDLVVIHESGEDTVNGMLTIIHPDIFAKGGDRIEGNTPEKAICASLGIEIVYGVGGFNKYNSSSDIIGNAMKMIRNKE